MRKILFLIAFCSLWMAKGYSQEFFEKKFSAMVTTYAGTEELVKGAVKSSLQFNVGYAKDIILKVEGSPPTVYERISATEKKYTRDGKMYSETTIKVRNGSNPITFCFFEDGDVFFHFLENGERMLLTNK